MVHSLEELIIVPCTKEASVVANPKKRSSIASIGAASIDPNLWRSREDFSGEVVMRCREGEVVTENGISVPDTLMDTYAYHEVIYGPKPWGMPIDHPQSSDVLRLPIPTATLVENKKVFLYTYFTIEKLDQATNIAYDIWLTQAPRYFGGAKPGDVELMIWIYRGSTSSWLPRPAGEKVGEVITPVYVDGDIRDVVWEVWYHPSVPWGGWSYIAFVSTKPSTDVAIELTEFLKHLDILLGWEKIGNLYVNNIEIGTEVFVYKPGSAGITWKLKKFYITTASPKSDTKELLLITTQT